MGKRTIAGVTFESEWYDAVKEPMSEPMYSEQDMEAKDREIERLKAALAEATKQKDTFVMRAYDLGQDNEILKNRLSWAQAENKQLREGLRKYIEHLKQLGNSTIGAMKTSEELAKLLEGRE